MRISDWSSDVFSSDLVVTYFNEVSVPTNVIDLQLWDLQSVQALSGPQGTLFGRNSTGGAILFVPQKPTDELEGYVEGHMGSHNLREITGVVNLPVSDRRQEERRGGKEWVSTWR